MTGRLAGRRTAGRRRAAAGALVVALGLVLTGCGSGQSAGPTDAPSSAASSVGTAAGTSQADAAGRPTHSGPTVTVPALPGPSSAGSATADASGGEDPTASSGDGPTTTTADAQATSGTEAPAESTAPAAPASSPTEGRPTSSSKRSTSSAPSVAAQVCDGCEVLGVATDVEGGFNAALIRTANGRGALATLDGSGKTVGGIGVPYGASFDTPFGGVLPCDDDGFCVVIATQADGHAIASVFRMVGSGAWEDASGDDGFPSETADARAVDVDGDGTLEVAVQVDGADGPVWLIYQRSGSTFEVLGCGAGADPPAAGDLSTAACGS